MAARVLVVMGSDNDFPVMKPAVTTLIQFGVSCEVRVCSAHRTPEVLHELIERVESEGCQVVIAGAGAAAHLAGVCAASTTLPVIGVPIDSSALDGLDSLLATVQMPGGIPVACMGIGSAGAKNAALFAVEIMALADADLARALQEHRRDMKAGVRKKDAALQDQLASLLSGDD